jgi:hypothetical protein
MSQENVELVRRAYERLGKNDPLGDWSWFSRSSPMTIWSRSG